MSKVMQKLDFQVFKKALTNQFDAMVKHGSLFRTATDKDELWQTYLDAFPDGTNEIYRERREYDCSCCKNFIRSAGNTIAILDGEIVSIWDIDTGIEAFDAVADAMSDYVKSKDIANQFLHFEKTIGTDKNYEDVNGKAVAWNHFFLKLPTGVNNGKDYVCKGVDIATELSESRSTHDVMLRSLKELTMDSVDTVLELIAQNSIYRAAEYKNSVDAFRKLKVKFDKLKTEKAKDIFVWSNLDTTWGAAARIRNTAIGTLLIDLSDGVDLEDAVRKFETSIMAPQNYKRPTALVSQSMVEKARKTLDELGLTDSLNRRYATLHDIRVNNILFANRQARKLMRSPFDGVATKKVSKTFDKVDSIPIEKFISDVIPNIDSMEVMVENSHANRLVSLIAPIDPKAPLLFKWGNGFSWAYTGDVTDSIKERVKSAGGNVTGDFCCRLAWYNHDDLDLHLVEPNGNEIFYGSKISRFSNGQLDVDMNAGGGTTRTPVENIFYKMRSQLKEGMYHLFVNQYAKRESENVGFEVEIDFMGDVKHYSYEKAVRDKTNVSVAEFEYSRANGLKFGRTLPSTSRSKTLWGVETNDFHKVNVLMRSPNYWDGEKGTGNRHYFFMLDGCINDVDDGRARGFYNEFLNDELTKHRKVLEIVGGKTKVDPSEDQLSGIGFSDSDPTELLIRVQGNVARTLKVII